MSRRLSWHWQAGSAAASSRADFPPCCRPTSCDRRQYRRRFRPSWPAHLAGHRLGPLRARRHERSRARLGPRGRNLDVMAALERLGGETWFSSATAIWQRIFCGPASSTPVARCRRRRRAGAEARRRARGHADDRQSGPQRRADRPGPARLPGLFRAPAMPSGVSGRHLRRRAARQTERGAAPGARPGGRNRDHAVEPVGQYRSDLGRAGRRPSAAAVAAAGGRGLAHGRRPGGQGSARQDDGRARP